MPTSAILSLKGTVLGHCQPHNVQMPSEIIFEKWNESAEGRLPLTLKRLQRLVGTLTARLRKRFQHKWTNTKQKKPGHPHRGRLFKSLCTSRQTNSRKLLTAGAGGGGDSLGKKKRGEKRPEKCCNCNRIPKHFHAEILMTCHWNRLPRKALRIQRTACSRREDGEMPRGRNAQLLAQVTTTLN